LSFFSSRWVACPEGVSELDDQSELPAGFRAAGIASGVKRSGRRDLGLLLCDGPVPVSAVALTGSLAPAAPVQVTRAQCATGALRAVLVNSGCANAATGQAGVEAARGTQLAAAQSLGVEPRSVALASTGSIASELPVDLILAAIPQLVERLSARGARDFAEAIMTTDRSAKRAHLSLALPEGEVRLSAQCKGAGMISPGFATMLCFIETDAQLEVELADELLARSTSSSFERITVDGQLSTNDSVFLLASGASGVPLRRGSEAAERFGGALDALLRQLAVLIVADGEGAERIARVRVRGERQNEVECAARAVANSPLVKAALHGGDPNWGRILQAVGGALAREQGARDQALRSGGALSVAIAIEGIAVCQDGVEVPVDRTRLAGAFGGSEVEIDVTLPGTGAHSEIYFSDLSYEYVRINSEYST
jgi:glutamate N-acetyltransferase/amino-acid N-acetyltransferase